MSRKISADSLDMEVLLETFEQELTVREGARNSNSQSTCRVYNQSQSPTSAFVTTVPFCQQPHSATECHTVPNSSARKKVLQSNGRCFDCLRRGHLSQNCRSLGKHKHCHGKHHTSICEKGSHLREQPSLASPIGLNPEAPAYAPSSTTSTICSTEGKAILLQTARTVNYNPTEPRFTVKVRLLFDLRGLKISWQFNVPLAPW